MAAFAIFASGLCGAQSVSAAIVGYTDYAAFQAAAAGSEMVINFDGLGGGTTVSTIGDVSFSISSGVGLQTYVTDGIDDNTVSPNNLLHGFGRRYVNKLNHFFYVAG